MKKTDGSKFANRLDAATYKNDAEVHFGIARSHREPESWLRIPERLVARLTSMGMAYELHHVQMIDIYDDTTFKSQQVEKLYAELVFLTDITKDPILSEALAKITGLIEPALGQPLHLMVSGN